MEKYNHQKIEAKWQKIWLKNKIYQPDLRGAKQPFYNLMMFPYPSAEGLHVGNMYAFTGSDIYGRFKRIQGFDVFEPIGLDGFGIHSENYALKIGEHPAKVARRTERNFYRQLEATGNGYAWANRLETYDSDYYKWTQWIFIQMFKKGLAYRKKAPVNWCPSCKTVLSDEQVEGEVCERCKNKVEVRELKQWFFKITAYAQRLLRNLDWIDWSPRVKEMQKNWIGKSEGLEIKFKVQPRTRDVVSVRGRGLSLPAGEAGLKAKDLEVFTTRPDTIYGVTFMAISPNHQLARSANIKALHPLTGEKLPIYVADYVVEEYGTAAVMGVPAYDERDLAFAKQNKIPVKKVPLENMKKITKKLLKIGVAKKKINYKLRDWCISRQRYWGPPIPMINCPRCSWVTVPRKDLPVKLPYLKDWKPLGTGQSPLAKVKEWVRVKCPKCQGKACRETDVSDTFLDSSWYFLRYPSIDHKDKPWDVKLTKKWLPVDMYIGGAEHSVLHLMYSRFLTMVFHDLGLLEFEEPYKKFRAHGLLISEGAKMSKSRGNVVIPDEYIKRYGADTLRMYLMFLGPFDKGGDFQDKGVVGVKRFLEKVWKITISKSKKQKAKSKKQKLETQLNKLIKKVTEDIESLKFNTAIAAMMEFLNELQITDYRLQITDLKTFLKLLAPFAPHISEELWHLLGEKNSIHKQSWPKYDSKLIEEGKITMAIQVNGKLRGTLELPLEEAREKEKVIKLAKELDKIKKYLKEKKVKKAVFVPQKILNFVV